MVPFASPWMRTLPFALLLLLSSPLSSLWGQSGSAASTTASAANLARDITNARAQWKRDSNEIERLLGKIKSQANTLKRVEGELQKLRASLTDLQREKIEALEDMRNGEFCSGCGQTRRALLAKGDPFPHPDQTIRAATPEELVKAANEYDERIGRLRERIAEKEAELKKEEGELTDPMHRFRVVLAQYHANIFKEQALRLAEWGAEKEGLEKSLSAQKDAIDRLESRAKSAKTGAEKEAFATNLRILRRQFDDSTVKATSAEGRARQQAQSFFLAVRDELNRLAKIAEDIPQRFGLPGGWFIANQIRNLPRAVEYTVFAVKRFDLPEESGVRSLLGEPTAKKDSSQNPPPSSQKSVRDLLEGK